MGDRRARAIRGATTVESDTPEQIRRATRELLETIVARNGITSADVIERDLHGHARSHERISRRTRRASSDGSMFRCSARSRSPCPARSPHCIRVLLHVETDASRDRIFVTCICTTPARCAPISRPDDASARAHSRDECSRRSRRACCTASVCALNVVRNSWCPSGLATK